MVRRASDDDVIDLAARRRQRAGTTFDDIAAAPIWVGWRLEPREGGGPLTKAPYNPATGRRAKSDDPDTWDDRQSAEKWAEKQRKYGRAAGIGLVLGVAVGDGRVIVGVDLDTCLDANGLPAEWAENVIGRFGSYCEISPSQTGAKIFALVAGADLPVISAMIGGGHGRQWKRGGGVHPPAIELHVSNRYFAATDERLAESPAEMRQIDIETVRWLVNEAGPAFVGNGKGKADSKTGQDKSRSAAAFRLAQALHQAGKTYDDFVAALLADPELAGWYREKGERSGEREAKRAWDRAQTADPAVAELNATYAMVLSGGKALILRETIAREGWRDFELLQIDAFKHWFANRSVPGGRAPTSLADYWLKHSQRRQYDGLRFAPMQDAGRAYNLWQGFAVAPRPGDCSLFLDHLRDNVCQGDAALFDWVVGWLAAIFQHPAQKSGTALVLRGKMGTGKTIVGKVIGSLLGRHYLLVTQPEHVTGRFNEHLIALLLLHCDEAFWAGDPKAEGVIKSMITADTMAIEGKFKGIVRVDNYVRLLVTGNPDWLVPAGLEERRFAVLDVGDAHREDHPYFAAIEWQMENGGREALLDYLLKFDLSRVNLRKVPKTSALLDQKIASLSPEEGWLLDLLRSGLLPWAAGRADNECPVDAVSNSYVQHAIRRGARRRAAETALGRFLKKAFPMLRRVRTIVGDDRVYVYRFPPLAECRKRFDELIQSQIDWGSPGNGFFDIDEWEKEPPPER